VTGAPGGAKGGLVSVVIGETGRPRRTGTEAGGTAQYSFRWQDGAPGELAEGCEGEPDLVLRISPEDACLVGQGRLSPSVAFMQGRLKTDGDNGLLLRLLAWTATAEFSQRLAELASPRSGSQPGPKAGDGSPGGQQAG